MRILAFLAMAAVLFFAVVWTQQRRLLYFPRPGSRAPAVGRSEHLRPRWTRPGNLAASGGSSGRAVMIVLFPGSGVTGPPRIPTGDALAERGFAVVLVDYRGYAGNPGAPTEAALAEDARRVVEFLARNHDRPIVYFGDPD